MKQRTQSRSLVQRMTLAKLSLHYILQSEWSTIKGTDIWKR